ncbi:MAG: hypothetical protein P8L68_00650 [Paracoccaceae bacterium]|nr:hypothetical protein [Paracoccaceae bacterium]MDG2256991.1 hypothetical protein [Paracoccaceae bacterium]
MNKKIIAVIVGVIGGMAAMMVINFISVMLYPMPEGLDTSDKAVMIAYIAGVPIGAKLLVVAGWMVSAFVAGLVAALIAPEGSGRTMAIVAGGILMLGGIMNIVMIPHPIWMMIIGLLQYIPLAHLGAKAAGK